MTRREFIALLGSSAVAFPLDANAESRLPRVGILLYGPMAASSDLQIASELGRAGYIEGRNIDYVIRAAGDDAARLPLLARELVAAKPDVIVGHSSQIAVALSKATKDIPIVMTVVGDPIGLGLTNSLSQPNHNVTGFTMSSPSLAAKRLQLLREIMPTLHRVGYLGVPANPLAPLFERKIEEAAGALEIKLVPLPVKSEADIDSAFHLAEHEAVQAVIAEADPLTLRFSASIIDHCLVYGLPCMHAWPIAVRTGALISYGPGNIENNAGAAVYVNRLLKGAKLSELPFEEPTKYELAINMKTAKALGLEMPPSLLARADEVIE
jgi:ABC-type uncharacterized transport system substrate-binding protein